MNNTSIEIKINGKIDKDNPIILVCPSDDLYNYAYNKLKTNKKNTTFEELYKLSKEEWFKNLCPESILQYESAYKKLSPIYKIKINDLKTKDLQNLINPYLHCNGLKKRMKVLLDKVYEYGEKYDYIYKNYAKFIDLGKDVEKIKRNIYSDEEIKKLWLLKKHDCVKIVLILIYSGMRLGEIRTMKKENIYIDESFMIGGIKTKSGKNRTIPINKKIKPLIKDLLKNNNNNFLIDTNLEQNQFNLWLRRKMFKLGFDHRSHDARHTFASKMRDLGVPYEVTATIMGHKCNNLLLDTYTHINKKVLINAVNKIKI